MKNLYDHLNKSFLIQDKNKNDQPRPIKKILFEAVHKGNLEFLKIAFKGREKIYLNLKKDDGSTLLHWAVLKNNPDIVRFLLIKGADPYVENDYKLSSFKLAEQLTNHYILNIMRAHEEKKTKELPFSLSHNVTDDILLKIFSHLLPMDLVSVSSTCKRFRKISIDQLSKRFFSNNICYSTVKNSISAKLNFICARENFVFGFSDRQIHIWEKSSSKPEFIFRQSRLFGDWTGYDFKIHAVGTLSHMTADSINVVCSLNCTGTHFYLNHLTKDKENNKWESKLYVLRPPYDTLCYAAEDSLIFYGKDSGKIEIIDTKEVIHPLPYYTMYAAEDSLVFCGKDSGKIEIVNTKKVIHPISFLNGHDGSPIISMVTVDSKLISLSLNQTIRIWDIAKQFCENEFKCDITITKKVNLSVQENKLLVYNRSDDNKLGIAEIIDLESGKLMTKFSIPHEWKKFTLFEDSLLITSTQYDEFKLVKLESLKMLKGLPNTTIGLSEECDNSQMKMKI